MNLIFKIKKAEQKGPARLARRESKRAPVEVILEKDKKIYKKTVGSADKVLEGLDRILKKSKIEITSVIGPRPASTRGEPTSLGLESIKIDDLNKNRYTSYRILKSIEKALKLL